MIAGITMASALSSKNINEASRLQLRDIEIQERYSASMRDLEMHDKDLKQREQKLTERIQAFEDNVAAYRTAFSKENQKQ